MSDEINKQAWNKNVLDGKVGENTPTYTGGEGVFIRYLRVHCSRKW